MNDINVMPGIDFRANKEKIRSKKRKEKRINKILNIGIFIGLSILVVGILMINILMNIVLLMYKKRNESTKTFLDVDYTSELEKNQIGGKYDSKYDMYYINSNLDGSKFYV